MSAGLDTALAVGLGAAVAVAAAVRSTWSPCGLSMLSTITPFGERSRGYRYWATASWFIAGSVFGGATLGAIAAALAVLVRGSGLAAHPAGVAGLAAGAALIGALVDGGVFGEVIPLWRRQVDDGWLVRYRRWVYAAGFGWQIGVGLATYIMTTAVLLLVVLAALTATPAAALGLGLAFGLVRGLAVLATAHADTPARLRDLHRIFHRAGPPVRVAVIVVQVLVAVVALAALVSRGGGMAAAGVALGVAVVVLGARLERRIGASRPHGGRMGAEAPECPANVGAGTADPVPTRTVVAAGAGDG